MIKVCPTCQQKYPEDTEFCAQDGTRLEELRDDARDDLLGRVLEGRWVIEERIGEGGMGSVYLASQRSVDRKVAIKTLKPELCNSREFVDRFFREARVASKIAHPHCVTILDFGQTDDGILYLAMEYLDGMPLSSRLRHPDMTVREVIQICMQIASALAAAHDNNIIHRDLKPDNVFLLSISDGSTFVKVLDFGIAKVTDSDEKMTQTGQVFGTPEYMSPEQCRGNELDGRSDLYSLGCILYRMLGGHPPFESDTPMAVLVSHVSEQPRHVRELIERADVPDELSDLCMRLLAKDRNQRPANAQAVRAELEGMLGNTTGPTGAISATAATSDEHVSGETLATDTGQGPLAADGGQASAPSGQQDGQQPAPKQPADMPSGVAASQEPASMRTESPRGDTSAPAAVQPPEKKSSMPLILIVGVVVLLSAGCVVGGLFYAYSNFGGEDGSFNIAGLFGSEAEGGDNAGQPSDDQEDDSVEKTALAVNDQNGDGDKSDGDKSGEDKSGDESGGDKSGGDKSGGDKSGEDKSSGDESGEDKSGDGASGDKNQGAAGGSGGAHQGDEPDGTKNAGDGDSNGSDSKNGGSKDGDSTHVEINANNVEVSVKENDSSKGDGEKSSGDDGASSGGSDKSGGGGAAARDKEKETTAQPPAPGNIRRSKLSTTGDACIKPNVDGVLSRAKRGFLSCYQKQLAAKSDLSGKVILSWNISTDGSLIRPDVSLSQMPEINSCLLGKLKRLRFDPPVGGRCYVRATYQFYP